MSKFRKMMNHPIMNKLCHKYQWLGRLLCKFDINHSLVVTAIHTEPFDIIARCKYCGKEFKGEKIMAYLEELLPELRKGEVRKNEVTFYEDRKDE